MGLTRVSLVFGRELETAQQPAVCGIPDKELPTVDHVANLVNHLHGVHNYAPQHLKVVSDQMKTRYDRLMRAYQPTCMKEKSPKLQSPWEGPYSAVTLINDVVYRIQQNPRSRMMVVHLDWLSPYQGAAWDKRP
jgi:hypothetical protein